MRVRSRLKSPGRLRSFGPSAKKLMRRRGGRTLYCNPTGSYFDTASIVSALEQGKWSGVDYSKGTRGLFSFLYCELSNVWISFSKLLCTTSIQSIVDYDMFTPSGERGSIGSWHSRMDSLTPHADSPWNAIDRSNADVHLHINTSYFRPYDCTFEFGLIY